MNVALWLEASARSSPSAPALLDGTTVVATYEQFAGRAASIAAALKARHGIEPGDRVAVFMANRTDYLECLYGIWWAGAVAVPVNAKLHGREAAWILQHAETKLAFMTAKSEAALREAAGLPAAVILVDVDARAFQDMRAAVSPIPPARRSAHDLAWLFYTSGTTGRPKGAMLSHGNLVAMSLSYLADVDTVTADDAALYAAPLSHGAGLYNFVHVRLGARHVVPPSQGLDPGEIFALARALKNVSLFAAPTMVRRLVEEARKSGATGEGIKTIVYGGGPMYLADIREALSVLGPRFVQIYGQGESPMTITALGRRWHAATDPRLGTVGRAQSVVEVRITGDDGEPLPADANGEVEVRGLTVMAGYWRDPEATAKSLRDGWLRTGDIGRLDADGFLTLTDRSKDVIISGGTNIYPREVEEVLLQHPAIQEASVIGAADAEWGEVVVACVVMRPEADASDEALDAHCLAEIARFKRPKRYIRLAELPKNSYGKVLKVALREMVAAARHAPLRRNN
jgi:acyl-CoA synthetase (AMP-forming)/AMP-acid ligase II